jgi:hypothetical protein
MIITVNTTMYDHNSSLILYCIFIVHIDLFFFTTLSHDFLSPFYFFFLSIFLYVLSVFYFITFSIFHNYELSQTTSLLINKFSITCFLYLRFSSSLSLGWFSVLYLPSSVLFSISHIYNSRLYQFTDIFTLLYILKGLFCEICPWRRRPWLLMSSL